MVSVAIPVETFIAYTTVTLREEEIVILIPPHLHPIILGILATLPSINGTLNAVLAQQTS